MAGQHANVAYSAEFNTVVTSDLMLAVLRGDVRTPADATAWLDRHRAP
jgi:hypothetical protein